MSRSTSSLNLMMLMSLALAITVAACLGGTRNGTTGAVDTAADGSDADTTSSDDTLGVGAADSTLHETATADTGLAGWPDTADRDTAPPDYDVGSLPDGVIVTHPLSVSVLCGGDLVGVAFTSTVAVGASNVFTAQLSGPDGDFSSFVNIGALTSTSSGVIEATIPDSVDYGSRYRVRVIATQPYTEGSDNGTDLRVGPRPFSGDPMEDPGRFVYIEARPRDVGVGAPVTWTFDLMDHAAPAPVAVHWEFGPDAEPPTSNEAEPTVRYQTAGEKSAVLSMRSDICVATADSTELGRGVVNVYDCTAAIPSDAVVVTGTMNIAESHGSYWVCAGGQLAGGAESSIFIEAGGGARFTGGGANHVWVQAGGSLDAGGGGGAQVIVKAAGASVSHADGQTVIGCEAILLDRTAAPSPGCP